MSDAVWPTLPGLTWDVTRTPLWRTLVQESASGKETRVALWSQPRYRWGLSYEILREETAFQEIQQLIGFFNARRGKFDSFLYSDPSDHAVTAQQFGTGDGAETAFQLIRTLGGFAEPVKVLNGSPAIYKNDWQGNQLQYPTARTNLCPYSENFTNWTENGTCTVTPDDTTAPDGTATADTLTGVSLVTDDRHRVINLALATPHSVSIFLKPVDSILCRVGLYVAAGVWAAYVDVAWSGGVPSTSASVGATGITYTAAPNGFYRLSFAATSDASTASHWFRICPARDNPPKSLYAWGADLKVGGTLSSYIKTPSSSSVTVTDYGLSSTGLVTFAAAPVSGAVLTWTGSYYWRVRFEEDEAEFNNFLYQLWELKKIGFISDKL